MTFAQIAQKLKAKIQALPQEIGNLSVNYFLEGFQKEGLAGEPKWKPRQGQSGNRTTRRNLLVKSGKLRRSIRIARLTPTSVSIGSNMPYAQIQNEGGTTHPKVTEKSRKYFWKMYKSTGNIFWKNMAITKKTSLTINIPARPFMKITSTLRQKINQHVAMRLSNLL